MPADFDLEAALRSLEVELRKLEIEYNSFFAGRIQRPPLELRGRVEAQIKQLDRATAQNRQYADRFRFQALQSRYSAFADLWDRGLKAREEGRPGPFSPIRRPVEVPSGPSTDRVLHVTVFTEPLKEEDKLHELYEKFTAAREEIGQPQLPFHKFAGLVREQVETLRKTGSPEVTFRLAVRDGKVSFTARARKGPSKKKA